MKRRTGVDISRRPGPVRLLRRECEKAKKALIMTTGDASFVLKNLHEGETYAKQLDAEFWFGLVKKRLEAVKKRVMDFIEEQDTTVDRLHRVVLIGGGGEIPFIRDQLEKVFGDKL